MNEIRPTVGIEFDNKYIDAKNKMIDFLAVFNELTETQKQLFTNEVLMSLGATISLEQFIKYLNNGGLF